MWELTRAGDMEEFMALAIQQAGGVAALALAAGVSERTVYAWKNGERHPSRNNLAKVSAYMESLAPQFSSPPTAGAPAGARSYVPGLSVGVEVHDRPGWYVPSPSGTGLSRIASEEGASRELRPVPTSVLRFPPRPEPRQTSDEGERSWERGSVPERRMLPDRRTAPERRIIPDRRKSSAAIPPDQATAGEIPAENGLLPAECAEENRPETFSATFAIVPFFADPLLGGPYAGEGEADSGGGYAFAARHLQALSRNTQALRLMYVAGRGMETLLHDGDICLVDTADTRLVDDRIYLLRYGWGFFVRRFSRMPGGCLFRNDNRELAHQDFELPAESSARWEVLGRIVWVGKAL